MKVCSGNNQCVSVCSAISMNDSKNGVCNLFYFILLLFFFFFNLCNIKVKLVVHLPVVLRSTLRVNKTTKYKNFL